MDFAATILTESGRVLEIRLDEVDSKDLAFKVPTEVRRERSVIAMRGMLYRYTPACVTEIKP